MMELKDKTILVLGLGATGLAACDFLLERGARVIGVDDLPRSLLSPKAEALRARGLRLFSHSEEFQVDCTSLSLLLLSPGVPPSHLLAAEARRRGIPVSGELEFASQFSKGPILAITGTNGKSTTTELCGALFKKAGFNIALGGNLGTPWLKLIQENPQPDWNILEVSSFQLESIESFHPKISMILNITDDHFERHGDMAGYIEAKAKIWKNQGADDALIYNANDVHVLKAIEGARCRKIPFSSSEHVKGGIYWDAEDRLISRVSGEERTFSLEKASLKGLHNIENMMAAIAAAELAGIAPATIERVLEEFKALPHRLEFVRDLEGVKYYDDSKGTNVGAVAMSLASFEDPVVLILGGKDKGGDYGILRALIKNKCRALVLIGEAKDLIRRALEGAAPLVEAASMQEAVARCRELSQPGDVVLLSPACSSFDMFRDYKHRGDEFQKWVRGLPEAGSGF